MCISISNRQLSNTFLYVPLLCGSLPLLGLLPLSNYLEESNIYPPFLINSVVWGCSILVVFWLFLALFEIHNRHKFFMSITFGCVFFAVPIGVMIPLSKVNLFGNSSELVINIALLVFLIGALLIMLFIIIKISFGLKNAYLMK